VQQLPYIRYQQGTQALVTDSASQILVNSTIYGSGKIIISTFNNTYSWMLTGNKNDYYSFWSTLLGNAAKKKDDANSFNYAPAIPRINQLQHVIFTGNIMPQTAIGGSAVYLKQNDFLPFEWEGNYWPTQAGWQLVNTQRDSSSIYIYGNDDWKNITAIEKLNATKEYVLQQSILPGNVLGASTTAEKKPFPKIYFLILFIISCSVLWVERKFNG
jgi:hypothetical protein